MEFSRLGEDKRPAVADESGLLTLRLTRAEVAFLASAIRETLEALDDWEFETRVGEDRSFAGESLSVLLRAYDETGAPQT